MKDKRLEFAQGYSESSHVTYLTRRTSLWSRLKKDKQALIAISILVGLIIISIFAFLSPYDPNSLSIANKLQSPSAKHWFGTDEYGRDYLTRILYGGRVSIAVGFAAMIVSIVVGVLIGTVSGYNGGTLDNLIMRFVDIFMSLPSFFLILILGAYLKLGVLSIILIIGLLSWMDVARIVRAETMTLKQREFVLYAEATGASKWLIIRKHIIPGIIPSIIVAASLNIANAILTESALSFLGLGIKQPSSSWGSMLNSAQEFIGQANYLAVFPGVCVLLLILSFNILGDSLQRAMKPKK